MAAKSAVGASRSDAKEAGEYGSNGHGALLMVFGGLDKRAAAHNNSPSTAHGGGFALTPQ
jgi:hypothetical protein